MGSLPQIKILFPFLRRHPDRMFVFKDQKACLTFDPEMGEILYLIGNFDTEQSALYNTHVAAMAKAAQVN